MISTNCHMFRYWGVILRELDTYHELYFMICILLYFVCICWLI